MAEPVDLAKLNNDGVKALYKKLGFKVTPGIERPLMVDQIRDAGHDKFYSQPSNGKPDEITALRESIKELKDMVLSLSQKVNDGPCGNCFPQIGSPKDGGNSESKASPEQHAPVGSMESTTSRAPKPFENSKPLPDTPELYASKAASPRKFVLAHPPPAPAAESKGLSGAKSIKRAVFHLSNLSMQTTAKQVVTHCEGKGVMVTACTLFEPRRKYGTLHARLTIDADKADVICAEDFWPPEIKVRAWRYDKAVRIIAKRREGLDLHTILQQSNLSISTSYFPKGDDPNSVIAQIWIPKEEYEKALSEGFWPDGVTAQPANQQRPN